MGNYLVRDGESDIIGDPVSISAGGTSIATTFDLTAKSLGLWGVTVTDSGGNSFTRPDAFTIEQGQAEVWTDVIGRDVIRSGRASQFFVLYGNRGNVDANGVHLFLQGVPLNATVRVNFGFVVTSITGNDGLEADIMPVAFPAGGAQVIQVQLDPVPPDFIGTLLVEITTQDIEMFNLQSLVVGP